MTPADPSDPRPRELGWIHLTDLHAGQPKEGGRLADIRDALIMDLERLASGESGHQKLWVDVVFFTGDIAFKGAAEEFGQATAALGRVLSAIRKYNRENGAPAARQIPLLLPVPGNHDLARPSASGAERLRNFFRARADNAPPLWNREERENERLVRACFREYTAWLKHPLSFPRAQHEGIVPGDMRCTIERGGIRLGVVGLNSAYLHLTDGDDGSLHLDRAQLTALVKEPQALKARHDVTVLMTHHPPESLSKTGRTALEDSILRHFDLHLYGHAHVGGHAAEPDLTGFRHGLMGRSLFGAEEGGHDRLHGYSAGRFRLESVGDAEAVPVVEFWSQPGSRMGGTWQFGPGQAKGGVWHTLIRFDPKQRIGADGPDTSAELPDELGGTPNVSEWPTLAQCGATIRALDEAPPGTPPKTASPKFAGARTRWLFLSGSVAGDRNDLPVQEAEEKYVETARPAVIRKTVTTLARRLAGSSVGLICGSAPSFVQCLAPALLERSAKEPWVILAHSQRFELQLVTEVQVLSALGEVICARQPLPANPNPKKTMEDFRKALAGFPGLVGSVYIGGKGGIKDEFDAFGDTCPDLPRLALGLGGGAAAELLLDPKTEAAAHGAVTTGDHPRDALPRPGRLWHTPDAAVEAICAVFGIE